MATITVTWDITNGAETKIITHPSGDVWNERNVCTEFMNENDNYPTSMDVIINEIAWFDKYSNENIDVYDKWVGKNLSIKNYISHLRCEAKEIESYSQIVIKLLINYNLIVNNNFKSKGKY